MPMTKQRNEDFSTIANLIYNCIVGAGTTHRLEWADAEIYGCVEKTDLKNGKRKFRIRLSEAAYNYWKTYFPDVSIDNLPHSKRAGFSDYFWYEHVMPRKVFKQILLNKYKNDPSNFNVNFILEVIEKCGRGVITLHSESQAMDSTYLRSEMPKGWDYETNFSPVECRLAEAGIPIHDEYFETLDF